MKQIVLIVCLLIQINLFANTNIQFGEEETKFLDNHKVLTVGIDPNFAPFEYIDNHKQLKGLSIDYLHELENILNIKFNIIKTKTWTEIIDLTKDGTIDLLSCIVQTPQRSEYLNFTEPYLTVPMVIVSSKTIGFINGIEDLKGKTVAVIDGYTPHQILEKKYKDIHLVKTKDITEALELVASGKTFAHVGNLSRVVYLLNDEGFQNLSISGITKYKYDFSFGASKNNPVLQRIIQKGLDSISQNRKMKIYNKWFPIKYKEAYDYTPIIYISITALIIILIFIFWMIKLKKEIKKRVLIEKQLNRNIKWLNNSLKSANIGAWYWDLRTNTIIGNSVYGKILGIDADKINISANEFQKEFVYKEDLPILLKKLEDYFAKTITTCSVQFRINSKDGKSKKVESKGKIFKYDSFNNPLVLFGFLKELDD